MGVAPLLMAIWLVAEPPAAPGGKVAVLDVSVTSIDEKLSPILTEVLPPTCTGRATSAA